MIDLVLEQSTGGRPNSSGAGASRAGFVPMILLGLGRGHDLSHKVTALVVFGRRLDPVSARLFETSRLLQKRKDLFQQERVIFRHSFCLLLSCVLLCCVVLCFLVLCCCVVLSKIV